MHDRAQAARATGRFYPAAVLLCALLPYAPAGRRKTSLEEALAALPGAYDAVRSIGLNGVAAALLGRAQELGTAATGREVMIVQAFWRGMLTGRSRRDCLEIIGAMAPWIAAHGGTEAVEECLAAIDAVGRWWP